MTTIIYMVRHAESPYTEGNERTRGLTLRGKADADKVTELLMNEGIDVIVSSPYARAMLTLEGLARQSNLTIGTYEDLREKRYAGDDYPIADAEFESAIRNMFADPEFALPGGESNTVCQERAMKALNSILEENEGKKVAIGTHGNVMTLMMNGFDSSYGYEFFRQTTKPDIYRLHVEGLELVEVTRLWKGDGQ